MKTRGGFTLIEVVVGVAVFLLFALGIYSALSFVFKIIYQSRIVILETALVSEELEVVRNVPYDDVGVLGGVPVGVLLPSKIVVRNGVSFSVSTTVRNVDDPFDGTVGGSRDDSSAADYKLVEVSAKCVSCLTSKVVTLRTYVAPKNLEGASKNGALFVHVFDAQGLPVSGAQVHIVNTAVSPQVVINDVTGNDGYLKIIDAPTGTMSYNISVTKNGYSVDFTTSSSAINPYPVKLPSNVVSQMVTNISFSIDRLASMVVHTRNPSCSPLSSAQFSLRGSKYIGVDPLVYKYATTVRSGADGSIDLGELEWDTYSPSVTQTYDVAGTIPLAPWLLTPGMQQDASLLLVPHTSQSLLVKVVDAGTGLPLSNASVSLSDSSHQYSGLTGLGYVRQTDWSNGSGASTFVDGTYYSDSGGLQVSSPAGDVSLRKTGQRYVSSGWLESATIDLGTQVDFNNVVFDPVTEPVQAGAQSMLLQIATSNSSTSATWNFVGPNGTTSTYYTSTSTVIHSSLSGKRYLRYRLYLATDDQAYTPQISEIAFTYTNSCTPPGQTFFGGIAAGAYTLTVARDGYGTNSGQVDVVANDEILVNMSPQ